MHWNYSERYRSRSPPRRPERAFDRAKRLLLEAEKAVAAAEAAVAAAAEAAAEAEAEKVATTATGGSGK